MDAFGQLPLTLAALEARLRRGEVFTIQGQSADGLSYALWFQEEKFLLRQGGDLHPFRQVQPALLTLLNCIGEFQASNHSTSQPGVTSALARKSTQHVDQRLRTIFARVAHVEEERVQWESNFEDLGMEGLSAGLDLLEIVAAIKDTFHVAISFEELEQGKLETVGAYQELLKSKGVL